MKNATGFFYISQKFGQFALFLYVFACFFPPMATYAVDDAFFQEDVYTQLMQGHVRTDGKREFTVDGRLIYGKEYNDSRLTPQEVGAFAKERLISEAAAFGIEKRDISKAIVEGHFTPSRQDLSLAFEGMGMPDNDYLREQGAHIVEYLIDNNGLNQDGSIPFNSSLFKYVIIGWRNLRWNKEFGSMTDMGKVKTVFDGKLVEVTGKDMVLLMLIRQEGSIFSNKYGIDRNASFRFKDLIERFEKAEDYDKANALKSRVNFLSEVASIVSFLALEEEDYKIIREKLYLPRLEKLSSPRIN